MRRRWAPVEQTITTEEKVSRFMLGGCANASLSPLRMCVAFTQPRRAFVGKCFGHDSSMPGCNRAYVWRHDPDLAQAGRLRGSTGASVSLTIRTVTHVPVRPPVQVDHAKDTVDSERCEGLSERQDRIVVDITPTHCRLVVLRGGLARGGLTRSVRALEALLAPGCLPRSARRSWERENARAEAHTRRTRCTRGSPC